MVKKETYHHGNLRETLIEEAHRLIGEVRLNQLPMRKLAETAGVSRTAAYQYFKDKRALLTAIAQDGFDQLKEQSSRIDGGLPAHEKMVQRC